MGSGDQSSPDRGRDKFDEVFMTPTKSTTKGPVIETTVEIITQRFIPVPLKGVGKTSTH